MSEFTEGFVRGARNAAEEAMLNYMSENRPDNAYPIYLACLHMALSMVERAAAIALVFDQADNAEAALTDAKQIVEHALRVDNVKRMSDDLVVE